MVMPDADRFTIPGWDVPHVLVLLAHCQTSRPLPTVFLSQKAAQADKAFSLAHGHSSRVANLSQDSELTRGMYWGVSWAAQVRCRDRMVFDRPGPSLRAIGAQTFPTLRSP